MERVSVRSRYSSGTVMLIRMRLTSHIPVQWALYQGKNLKTNLREGGNLMILTEMFSYM